MSIASPEPIWRPEVVPGERIFLSHPRREDIPLYARWFADLELTAYLGRFGASFTLENEQQWFDSLGRDPGQRSFAIIVRAGQRLIGNVTLGNIDHQHGRAELGIGVGDKEYWGKGYGSEAVRLMADYGLTFLGLHTIYLWHLSFNERGHRAYLKAGFQVAGRLRSSAVFNGRRYDRILMDITREDLGPSRLAHLVEQVHNP